MEAGETQIDDDEELSGDENKDDSGYNELIDTLNSITGKYQLYPVPRVLRKFEYLLYMHLIFVIN